MQIDQIKQLVLDAPCSTAIVIRKNKQTVFENSFAEKEFKAASLIKLGIALYIREKAPETINETVVLKESDIVGGAGIINRLSIKKWHIRDLIDLMLCVSDNTATNLLLNFYKIDTINNYLNSNYHQVQLGRYLMKNGKENLVSAATITDIFEKLLQGNDETTAIIKNALHHQESRTKLVALSDPSWKTFNKTGELGHEEHDMARFVKGTDQIDCCVMTHYEDQKKHQQVIQMIQKIGQIITNI